MVRASPLVALVADDEGRELPGASRSRIMSVVGGSDYHVKLVRAGSNEPRRGPANELLANRLLHALGVPRNDLALITIPAAIRTRSPEMAEVMCNEAFGLPALEPAPMDLPRATVQALGPTTDGRLLIAQDIVLRWMGNTDHEEHNFIDVRGQAVAVDFAATPVESVWANGLEIVQPLDEEYGGLGSFVAAAPETVARRVLRRFDFISAERVRRILDELPPCWATDAEKGNVVTALMRRKGGVRGHY